MNLRLLAPEASALPGCATPRRAREIALALAPVNPNVLGIPPSTRQILALSARSRILEIGSR